MNGFEFEQANRAAVEAELPDVFDGRTFNRGDKIARLTCEDGTAYLYLISGEAAAVGSDGHMALGAQYTFPATSENVERVAKAIVWHLQH